MPKWRIQDTGKWTDLRRYRPSVEVDFHPDSFAEDEDAFHYEGRMMIVRKKALNTLIGAYNLGLSYVLFTHGHSTSGVGKTTARSEVRGLMRSPDATPFIVRRDCIQHRSAFLAKIRKNPQARLPELTCPRCQSSRVKERGPVGNFNCKDCAEDFDWLDYTSQARQ